MKARLLLDSPAPGTWNMAVDEVLLESAAAGVASLRFYAWQEPTLSLGYFQAAADRDQHAASRECPLVRRASGGGAIVHDRELTYSIALPLPDTRAKAATELYDACHETLVAALSDFGVAAALYRSQSAECGAIATARSGAQPFLCFQRRACGDVVSAAVKIAGSAQRRRRCAVLQHGSILLDRSLCAPELPGIAQQAGRVLDARELAACWSPLLAKRLNLSLVPDLLSVPELENVRTFAIGRFAADSYTLRR